MKNSSTLLTAISLSITFLCSGCDFSSFSTPPVSAACAQIGSQCQLPDGPLGVCEQTHCKSGQQPPCFSCTSQH